MHKNLFKAIILTFSILMFTTWISSAQELSSPNGRLKTYFSVDKSGQPIYRLTYDNKYVVKDSKLGFILLNDRIGNLTDGFNIINTETSSFDETWSPVWGEEDTYRNKYNELLVNLKQLGTGREMAIRFRLFDDGLGFRYEFPSQKNLTYFTIKEEVTEFAMTGNHTAFWLPGDYDTEEYDVTESRISEIRSLYNKERTYNASQHGMDKIGVQTPLQLKTDDGLYINIHEAALIDFPAINLEIDDNNFIFRTHLTPDATGAKGHVQTAFNTPWRTIIVSDDARDILSSKLVYNLNEPCAIKDVSWIKPMKYMGVWWEMITGKTHWSYTDDFFSVQIGKSDYKNAKPHGRHGANTKNVMRYIDFASKNGIKGMLVEGWNIGWEDWFGHQKDYVFDFVTPYPDFDLPRIRDYAKSKGVKMIMHHETSGSIRNYERHLDKAFSFMKTNGYDAVKTGYVGNIIPYGEYHYGQWLVNHYMYVVKKAAEYKIMVNAHEAVHMTGLSRTYPNLLSQESAKGQEFQTSGNKLNHLTLLPFTRLIGGPMDYTPGIVMFDLKKLNPNNHNMVQTTICNQLGSYLTMYTPLQMAADLPEHYEAEPRAFEFIKDVPVMWSESKYLEAEPGRYISVARREKGKRNWYIGNVSGVNRVSAIKLDFLEPGVKYEAKIWQDGKDAKVGSNPYDYTVSVRKVSSKTILKLNAVEGGGWAVSIKPIL
jgi:hypothetical protein